MIKADVEGLVNIFLQLMIVLTVRLYRHSTGRGAELRRRAVFIGTANKQHRFALLTGISAGRIDPTKFPRCFTPLM